MMARFRAIKKALRELEADNGSPFDITLKIAEKWWDRMAAVDQALAGLSAADLETFCMGETSEMQAIARRSQELKWAHKFLEDVFNWGAR